MMTEELVTVEEASKILKVRRETIRRYITNGHLKALTLPGGDYRLREKDVHALLRPGPRGGKCRRLSHAAPSAGRLEER